jgi:hypothetical protein
MSDPENVVDVMALLQAAAGRSNGHTADRFDVDAAIRLACSYAQAGVPAFPVRLWWDPAKHGISKAPANEHGHLDASTDLDVIQAAFTTARLGDGQVLGVGLHPGGAGALVLDVDVKGEDRGDDELVDLEHQHEPIGHTPRATTPSGGAHLWLDKGDVHVGGRDLAPGINVRADAGWVVAPGTVTPWGRWEWEDGTDPREGCRPLRVQWVLDILGSPNGQPGAAGHWQPLVRGKLGAADLAALVALERLGGHDPYCAADGSVQVVRPGKVAGNGASVGHVGPGLAKVWTSKWAPLVTDRVYDADHLAAVADAVEAGDWDRAARLAAETSLDRLVSGNGQHLGDGDEGEQGARPGGLWTVAELLNRGDPEYDWLVPDLIERGDRIILTGDEGQGKSTLIRQIGLGAAVGLNPLLPLLGGHRPIRVLLVDCENSDLQLKRELVKQLVTITARDLGDRFQGVTRLDGLVLDDPRDRLGDRAWLQAKIDQARPDLLLIGPLYKLLGGDPKDEAESRELARFLDRLRQRCALVIEAHAPHGEKRPYGWSGWKRWPEFGFHLTAQGMLTAFRGARDDSRQWPAKLHRGKEGGWLWVPDNLQQDAPPVDRVVDSNDADSVRQRVQRMMHELFDIDPERWLTAAEVCDRVVGARTGRASMHVRRALAHFADRGWLLTRSEERQRGPLTDLTETYRWNPQGPGGP